MESTPAHALPAAANTAPAPALSFFGGVSGAMPLAMEEEQGQLELELEGLIAAEDEKAGKSRGQYTADMFRRRDPHRYKLIVRALGMKLALNAIARMLGVAWETVRAVQRAEEDTGIREQKKRFADSLSDVIELGMDGLMEKARKGQLGALDIGILIDKHQLLSGEATSITETRGEDPSVAAYLAWMGSRAAEISASPAGRAGAGDGARPVSGTVIDVAAETSAGGMEPLGQEGNPP